MYCKSSHKPSVYIALRPGLFLGSILFTGNPCRGMTIVASLPRAIQRRGGLSDTCVLTVQNQKVLLLVEFHGLVKWPFNKIVQSQWNCSNIIEVTARLPRQSPSLYLNASESRTWPCACNQFEQAVRCFGIWRWKVLCKCQASFTGALHPGWEAQRARDSSTWC